MKSKLDQESTLDMEPKFTTHLHLNLHFLQQNLQGLQQKLSLFTIIQTLSVNFL